MEEKLIERLEAAVVRLEALSGPAGVSREFPADIGGDAAKDPSILAFDDLISQYVDMVSAAAEKIGGQVLEVTKIIAEAFYVQRELLIKIKQTQKPDMAGLGEFLKPFNEVIMKANRMTEGRRSDFFNHLKAATDSLTALAWIAYSGKDCGKRKYGVMLFAHGYPALEFRTMKRPVQYSPVRSNQNKSMSAGAAIKSSGMSMPISHVEESWQTAEFYSNKVLVEYKNKDPNHVEWTKALKELYLPGLRDYVKSHYPLGAVWNASGKKVSPAPAKAPTPGAPAPPPHPPASPLTSESSQPSSSRPKDGMAAVFQDISSGNITAGLRKVTADMKTKNRTDRSGVVPVTEKGTHASSSSSVPKTGPPKLELQMGRKWVVENQIGKKDLVIDNCDSKQTVYIYGCKDSVVQIQGKVNNITVDKCTKMGVVFKDLVAACELVNCNSVEVQCQGSAPTISVDNTAGCQLYLSKESLGTSITTAKATEINVLVPSDDSDGDWIEHALPQQFLNEFKDGRFETTPVSHSGG